MVCTFAIFQPSSSNLHTKLFSCCVHDSFKGVTISGFPFGGHISGFAQLCAQVVIPLSGVADISGDLISVSHNCYLHCVVSFTVYSIHALRVFVKAFLKILYALRVNA
nr:MAG TPA: hypothetical protein [Caudoviricetes sp.]